jgi:hypothetical protein
MTDGPGIRNEPGSLIAGLGSISLPKPALVSLSALQQLSYFVLAEMLTG